jgi:hypothetical protein
MSNNGPRKRMTNRIAEGMRSVTLADRRVTYSLNTFDKLHFTGNPAHLQGQIVMLEHITSLIKRAKPMDIRCLFSKNTKGP